MRLLLFFVLICLCNTVFSGEPDKKLHEQCLYPTVQIFSSHNATGTGVIVRSEKIKEEYVNVVLSCSHITSKNAKYGTRVWIYKDWSTLSKTENYRCMLYANCAERDISVFIFTSKNAMPCASIDLSSKLYMGSDVYAIGCGGEEQPRLGYGKITSPNIKLPSSKHHVYRSSIYVIPGDSGGPIFHEYKVVGIAQAIKSQLIGESMHPLPGISYVIPISKFEEVDVSGDWKFAYDQKAKIPKLYLEFFKLDNKLNR